LSRQRYCAYGELLAFLNAYEKWANANKVEAGVGSLLFLIDFYLWYTFISSTSLISQYVFQLHYMLLSQYSHMLSKYQSLFYQRYHFHDLFSSFFIFFIYYTNCLFLLFCKPYISYFILPCFCRFYTAFAFSLCKSSWFFQSTFSLSWVVTRNTKVVSSLRPILIFY